MSFVAIIDYGMGNVRSVLNATTSLGAASEITADPARIRDAAGVILPGVGAFPDAMRSLTERGLAETLTREVREKGKPFLGICLGMQVIAEAGFEHGREQGLGWVRGEVLKLDAFPGFPAAPGVRLPHIGWNTVSFERTDGLFQGLGAYGDFYFVHSYAVALREPAAVSGVANYGIEFVAALESENICATQFHPEKSQKAGIKLLSNWLQTLGRC